MSIKGEKVFHDEEDGTVENIDIIPTSGLPTHLAEDVSYGPNGVAGIVSSPLVFGAALLASFGGFSFGYDQGVISIINVMDQFHDVFPRTTTAFGKSFMTAMLEFGAFLGCFFMPWLADKISRKKALAVVVVIFNVGAVLQTAAVNYEMLVLGRTIGGIGVGTLALGAPLYISEISPPNLRGTLLVLESISICTGVVVSFYITYGTRHMDGEIAFRLPLGLQMVSATIVGVGIFFFPYSPRWLALVGRNEDALTNLARMRQLPADDHRVQTEYRGIIAEAQFQKTILERRHPGQYGFKLEILTWLDLFSPNTWRRTAVGCGVLFFQQFSGINAFIYYAPTLFQSLGQSEQMALDINFLIGVAVPPMLSDIGFGTYVFFACWCALAAVWAYFLVPETKGKTLEQMDEVFGDNSGQEEKEIMRATAAQAMSVGVPTHQV
ncbi:hypothetical protein ACJZ2D_011888 [Fusarium nematophilum]